MSPENQAIFDAALDLPEDERAELAELLLDSLPPTPEELARDGWVEVTDDELFAELERRRAEFEKDPSVAVPWSEIKLEGLDESDDEGDRPLSPPRTP
jgi:putative addiction module component (TIGR02574 family)